MINIFIDKCKIKYCDTDYDYSLVDYVNSQTKVKIICPIHGVFEKTPNKFLMGQECNLCSRKKITLLMTRKIEDVIIISNIIHNNKYDYSLVDYINSHIKVKIICPIHGIFNQKMGAHINRKNGCPKCGISKSIKNRTCTKDDFIIKANSVHNFLYDYSLTDYKNAFIKVKIICKKHGIFEQSPNTHLGNKSGCPICRTSKGELSVKTWLDKNNIPYSFQHKFHNCKNQRKLSFDFYLPDQNICIEYNGRQHYEPIWGEKHMNRTVVNDNIKRKYCEIHSIKLLIIKHDDDLETLLVDKILRAK